MKTWNNKCSNKTECDNGKLLNVTQRTITDIKKGYLYFVAWWH
jgi:hypothetical protein